ncbi:type II toxin-antitoxin system PemK/MazF family toxin [Candidatus Poriferisocius sp.]|uniref:type II toxin-antitoxin system PemK/MazF family toxin n=1 Tax=Candidatus Poriferisocius sp. TaxID=3101276 RepID=UPI003B5BBD8E
MNQGDIWLMEQPTEEGRPVVIVSRNGAIPVLNSVVVAPVTSTLRPLPTCLPVGAEEGLAHDSVATFDNLTSVPKSILTRQIGSLNFLGRQQMCEALHAMSDC